MSAPPVLQVTSATDEDRDGSHAGITLTAVLMVSEIAVVKATLQEALAGRAGAKTTPVCARMQHVIPNRKFERPRGKTPEKPQPVPPIIRSPTGAPSPSQEYFARHSRPTRVTPHQALRHDFLFQIACVRVLNLL